MTHVPRQRLCANAALDLSVDLRRFIVRRNWREGSKTMVRTADTPPGEVAEADLGRLGMITRNHPVRTLTFRKSSVTGEMVCPLPAQRGPALSLQLTSEQSAMRRDDPLPDDIVMRNPRQPI